MLACFLEIAVFQISLSYKKRIPAKFLQECESHKITIHSSDEIINLIKM